MHKPVIAQLVYKTLFPRTRNGDPTSFAQHVTRNIVPEVRLETAAFYGQLDNIEAQYPGLDYDYAPHRARLSRYTHHRRLFRAFDALRLTRAEILSLCQWEGTKAAKDKYERDSKTQIRDTTLDGIARASPSRPPVASITAGYSARSLAMSSTTSLVEDSASRAGLQPSDGLEFLEEAEESSDELYSCGDILNQHLQAAAEARSRGENVPLDGQFEQWLRHTLTNHGGDITHMDPSIPAGTLCPTTESSNPSARPNTSDNPSSSTASIQWASLARASPATIANGSVTLLSAPTNSFGPSATASANPSAGEAR